MKLKDLPKNYGTLTGIKIKIPKKHPECPLKEGYWKSQWGYENGNAGVFVTETLISSRIYPIFLNKLKEALEFEVV